MRLTNNSINSGVLIQQAIDDAGIPFAARLQAIENGMEVLENKLIGTIQTFASTDISDGFLLCDGKEYNKNDYPKLYEKIGDFWGDTDLGYSAPSGDGLFRVPDLRELFIRGASDEVDFGTKQDDMMRKIVGRFYALRRGKYSVNEPTGSFTRTGTWNAAIAGGGNDSWGGSFAFDSSRGVVGQEGSYSANVGHETRPKNMRLVFAIQAK